MVSGGHNPEVLWNKKDCAEPVTNWAEGHDEGRDESEGSGLRLREAELRSNKPEVGKWVDEAKGGPLGGIEKPGEQVDQQYRPSRE